jgi:hypothetical protein
MSQCDPCIFTGDKYEVSGGGITSIVPVPADEFVISFSTSGSDTYIYLLADDDVMASDMIYIQISSYYAYAGTCKGEYSHYQTHELPYKQGRISRGCSTAQIYSSRRRVSTHSHFKFEV